MKEYCVISFFNLSWSMSTLSNLLHIITRYSLDFSEYFNSPDSGYILMEGDSEANGADMSSGVDVKKMTLYTGN